MNIGLYQSASALSALERWQDAVTHNITSGDVTGFKKMTVGFRGQNAGELQTDPRRGAGEGQGASSIFPGAQFAISFAQGETQPTRNPKDLALQGDGFFEVQTADGRRGYTRMGALHEDSDGVLRTPQNVALLTEGGTPIQVVRGGGELVVNSNGTLFQGSTALGKISVVKFADNKVLQPTSNGVYTAPAGVEPVAVERPEVLQGYLESSNVRPLREMMDLVNIARAYEINQKLITSRDQTMQKTLDTLG